MIFLCLSTLFFQNFIGAALLSNLHTGPTLKFSGRYVSATHNEWLYSFPFVNISIVVKISNYLAPQIIGWGPMNWIYMEQFV